MLPDSPCFILYIETIKNLNLTSSQLKSLINKYSLENIYFFTHKCNISIKSLINQLNLMDIPCSTKNVLTPTYLLAKYCKTLKENFSAYPITDTNDLWDFYSQGIEINYKNPDMIFICTNKLEKNHLDLIYNSDIPIVISSNLCHNRLINCTNCLKNCPIKNFTSNFKNRLIMPDSPPIYSSAVFKELNIHPKHTVLITHSLRDDYIQYKRFGCKVILLLSKNCDTNNFYNSPHNIDIVADNFDNLCYFFNFK